MKLLHKEEARRLSGHMKRIKNKPHCGAISKVEVPVLDDEGKPRKDANGKLIITTHDTQETVEPAIMETIEKRYKLAHQSPFLQEPLLSILGLTGTTDAAKRILDGTFVCPEGLDDTTRLIIQLLQRPLGELTGIDADISMQDYHVIGDAPRKRHPLHSRVFILATGKLPLSATNSRKYTPSSPKSRPPPAMFPPAGPRDSR
jgi:hypothetical protein